MARLTIILLLIGTFIPAVTLPLPAQEKQVSPEKYTGLNGPYLGQKPPGRKAVPFAAGIISSKKSHEFCCAFSPDGKEIYFNRSMVIMVTRRRKKGWTVPEPVSFTEGFDSHEAYITPDNKRLYYGSKRPTPGKKDEKNPYGIWMVERTPKGWSKPAYVGYAMFVSSTEDGVFYLTDISSDNWDQHGIARTRLVKGRFGKPEPQLGPLFSPAPDRKPGRHPCIAPDENFIIFDAYKKDKGGAGALFVSFREPDGSWGNARNLGDNVNTGDNICPSLSPDGKYLFYHADSDIYWVSTEVIHDVEHPAPKCI